MTPNCPMCGDDKVPCQCVAEQATRRRRDVSETVPEMVPKWDVDRKIQEAKMELRQEWQLNIDRRAIEAAAGEAHDARDESRIGAKTSHRRWMILISFHAVTLAAVLVLAGAFVLQRAYVHETRARIERMERLADIVRGAKHWRDVADGLAAP